jgi:hypothetical protein
MKELLLIIRDLIYLVAIGIWIVAFFLDRDIANQVLPLMVVFCFFNLDSRVSDIVKRMKELNNGKN